jgi:hypothetical protein
MTSNHENEVVDDRPVDSDEGDPSAVPGVDSSDDSRAVGAAFLFEVDGELFDVRDHGDSTDYTWLSGPNQGYGFGTSGAPRRSVDQRREDIRSFLAMVDPATGYIEDD